MTKELSYQEAIEKLVKISDALTAPKEKLSDEMSEIITALQKQHRNDPTDDNYDDVWTMFDDIREYAKNNGRAVISEDRPAELRLAWRCTNTDKTWSIRISNVKKSMAAERANENRAKLLQSAILTQEGKANLTASLNSKDLPSIF